MKSPVKGKPIAGCCRIHIPVENYRSIKCVLNLEDKKVEVSGSSGERYLCREFGVGATMLAIGIEDENPAFESERVENGMEYRINDRIDEVATRGWYRLSLMKGCMRRFRFYRRLYEKVLL